MSNHDTVSNWVHTHLVDKNDMTHITKVNLNELEMMADAESKSLSNRAFRCILDNNGNNTLTALSTLRLNNHNPTSNNYMDNAFAVVLLKRDPYSTDGIYMLIQIVPGRYVLQTTIRCNKSYVVTGVLHTYYNQYVSDRTKSYVVRGTLNGKVEKSIFIHKNLHDAMGLMESPDTLGNNDIFTITLPNGTVVVP